MILSCLEDAHFSQRGETNLFGHVTESAITMLVVVDNRKVVRVSFEWFLLKPT